MSAAMRLGRSAGQHVAVPHAAVHRHVSCRSDARRVSVSAAVRRVGTVGVGPLRRGDHADRRLEIHARRSARLRRRAEARGQQDVVVQPGAADRPGRRGRVCDPARGPRLDHAARASVAMLAGFAWPFVLLLGSVDGDPVDRGAGRLAADVGHGQRRRDRRLRRAEPQLRVHLSTAVAVAVVRAVCGIPGRREHVRRQVVRRLGDRARQLVDRLGARRGDDERSRQPSPRRARSEPIVAPPAVVVATPGEEPITVAPAAPSRRRGRSPVSCCASRIGHRASGKSLLDALAAGYQAGFLWVSAVGGLPAAAARYRRRGDGRSLTSKDDDFGMPPLADDAATGVPEVAAATKPAQRGRCRAHSCSIAVELAEELAAADHLVAAGVARSGQPLLVHVRPERDDRRRRVPSSAFTAADEFGHVQRRRRQIDDQHLGRCSRHNSTACWAFDAVCKATPC